MKSRRLLAYLLYILIVSSLFTSCKFQKNTIEFTEGTYDVEVQDFSKVQAFHLKGKIDFFWKQWPISTEGDFDKNRLKESIPVDINSSFWVKYKFDNKGFGTYHFKMVNVSESLILNLSKVRGACEVWVNEKKIMQHGTISKDGSQENIDARKLIIPLPNQKNLDIYILISNHQQRMGGGLAILNTIQAKKNYTAKTSLFVVIEAILLSLIILFGIYQLLNYWLTPTNKSFLFLGMFCLIGSTRQLFDGQYIAYYLFEELHSNVILKIHYIGYYGALATLVLYHNYILPRQAPSFLFKIIAYLNSIGIIYVLIMPPFLASYSTIVFQFIGITTIILGFIQLLKAMKANEPYAVEIFISMLAGSIFLIIDLLNAMLFIQSEKLINYGFLIYVVSQIIISKRMHLSLQKDYSVIKNSSNELKLNLKKKENEISKLLSESQLNLKSKETILNELRKVKKQKDYTAIQGIISELAMEITDDKDSIITENGIEKMNKKLTDELKRRFPKLTKTDLKICMYISMKLNRKDIARLRNISLQSFKSNVYRIRKKMNLPPDITLNEYIHKINSELE